MTRHLLSTVIAAGLALTMPALALADAGQAPRCEMPVPPQADHAKAQRDCPTPPAGRPAPTKGQTPPPAPQRDAGKKDGAAQDARAPERRRAAQMHPQDGKADCRMAPKDGQPAKAESRHDAKPPVTPCPPRRD